MTSRLAGGAPYIGAEIGCIPSFKGMSALASICPRRPSTPNAAAFRVTGGAAGTSVLDEFGKEDTDDMDGVGCVNKAKDGVFEDLIWEIDSHSE
jgi:hypothetical protein